MKDVDAGMVISPTDTLKSNIESLSSSFTVSMIDISTETKMDAVEQSIKDNAQTNCETINTAAKAIANTANTFSLGGEA